MIIYKATNLVNGKVYIGQTVQPLKNRMGEHLRVKKKTYFEKALIKYGVHNFCVTIIDKAESVNELNQKEIFWIKFYNAFGRNGYNMCEGGGNTTGYHHTETTKEIMSKKKIGLYNGKDNPFYGKKHSKESSQKMSESRKGRYIDDEWRKHISESSKQKRKVRNIETAEVFNSIKEAADKYNIVPTHITRVCRGRRNTTGGYHWEYIS